MMIKVTLQEIKDKGGLEVFCELKGMNPEHAGHSANSTTSYEFTTQEAIDIGVMPGEKTPRKKMRMQVDGAVIVSDGHDFGPLVLSEQFILFGVPWIDDQGGLGDVCGSWATLEEALAEADRKWNPGLDVTYQIMDKSTGECWKVRRMESCDCLPCDAVEPKPKPEESGDADDLDF
jgi:hypothetical protein